MKANNRILLYYIIVMVSILYLLRSCKKDEIPTTVTDIDGNIYKTVTIGTQTWMAENLKTTKYQNGDLIGTTIPASLDIVSEITPKYQWAYAGNEFNVSTYGRLYTWYAVTDERKICPNGWHVPTEEDFITLVLVLDDSSAFNSVNYSSYSGGGKLKETGTIHWLSPNTGATDESGFTALPGGRRDISYKIFYGKGVRAEWWCFTEYGTQAARVWQVYNNSAYFYEYYENKRYGCSVRCIMN